MEPNRINQLITAEEMGMGSIELRKFIIPNNSNQDAGLPSNATYH